MLVIQVLSVSQPLKAIQSSYYLAGKATGQEGYRVKAGS